MNHGGVCRTAPATPGLLNILVDRKVATQVTNKTFKEDFPINLMHDK